MALNQLFRVPRSCIIVARRYSHQLPTIYSMATPPKLKSAVAIVRVSGNRCSYVYEKLTKKSSLNLQARKAHLRSLYDRNGKLIDDALVLYFKGPHSFTGEDVLEFQIHGGRAISELLLSNIRYLHNRDDDIEIRMAEPGEFSRRAFLNNKFDLTSLEGINSMIHANTESERRSALQSFTGRNKKLFGQWRQTVLENSAKLTAVIDFAEDADFDSEFNTIMSEVKTDMSHLRRNVQRFINKVERASLLQNGINMAFLGSPNVGKSSLLNQIVNDDISIVSDIPGTTRDVVTSVVDINGYKINLCDTAGIRLNTDDRIEKMGIERAIQKCQDSDVCVCVLDSSSEFPEDVKELLDSVHLNNRTQFIFVLNKTDLVPIGSSKLLLLTNKIKAMYGKESTIIPISCLTGVGIDTLLSTLTTTFKNLTQDNEEEDPISVSDRAREILTQDVLYGIDNFFMIQDEMNDVVIATENLRYVADGIGKITGEVIGLEEVLEIVFSKFCVGK